MYANKEFRDKLLMVLDDNEGDIHLQAEGIITLLKEEELLTEDDDEFGSVEDSEDEEDSW